MTVGSLFSGIGGFDLGFERAGMAVRWQCEKDAAARGLLRRRWPNTTIYEDVCDVGTGTPAVDLVCGGFPCQDVSIAGRRAGLAGKRSGLWFEFHRILGDVKPEWVVVENVPGLLSSNGGRDFAIILRGLVELGYGVVWRVLDSQYFGVAQRRRRLFIVGHAGDGRAAEVLFERDGGCGHSAPGSETREGTTASPSGIAGTVSSKWAKGAGGPAGDEHYNLIAFHGGASSTAHTMGESVNLSPTLRANGGGMNRAPYITGTLAASGAGSARPAGQRNEIDMLIDHSAPRRLTPLECERLQGFPDGWTSGQSDAPRYRQLGNAVTVNVAEWIGRRIAEAS